MAYLPKNQIINLRAYFVPPFGQRDVSSFQLKSTRRSLGVDSNNILTHLHATVSCGMNYYMPLGRKHITVAQLKRPFARLIQPIFDYSL